MQSSSSFNYVSSSCSIWSEKTLVTLLNSLHIVTNYICMKICHVHNLHSAISVVQESGRVWQAFSEHITKTLHICMPLNTVNCDLICILSGFLSNMHSVLSEWPCIKESSAASLQVTSTRPINKAGSENWLHHLQPGVLELATRWASNLRTNTMTTITTDTAKVKEEVSLTGKERGKGRVSSQLCVPATQSPSVNREGGLSGTYVPPSLLWSRWHWERVHSTLHLIPEVREAANAPFFHCSFTFEGLGETEETLVLIGLCGVKAKNTD